MSLFRLFFLFLLITSFLLPGCSGKTVRHLPYKECLSGVPQSLQMRYLSFQYQVLPVDSRVGIVAEAFPVVDRLPSWVSWYSEANLDIYLTNKNGNVLALKRIALVPRPLDGEVGLPVEASFDLGTAAGQPLFVAFGYRLILSNGSPDQTQQKILVTEGALDR